VTRASVSVKSQALPVLQTADEEVVPLFPAASDTQPAWQENVPRVRPFKASDVFHATFSKSIESLSDTGAAAKILFTNPAEGVREAYQKLGKSKALQVAICCLILFDVSILIDGYQISRNEEAWSIPHTIFERVYRDSPISFYAKLSIVAAIPLLSLAGAMFTIRSIARGIGSWQSDMFVGGIALVPFAVVILASNILGIGNVEFILFLYLVVTCLHVLILFHGFRDLCGLGSGFASYAVPGAIILSAYLTKVVLFSLLT